jgi:hypothetical protein
MLFWMHFFIYHTSWIIYHVFARSKILNDYTKNMVRYMGSLNHADLRLITFERLIFIFPSIMNFRDEWMVGINFEFYIYHNPENTMLLRVFCITIHYLFAPYYLFTRSKPICTWFCNNNICIPSWRRNIMDLSWMTELYSMVIY